MMKHFVAKTPFMVLQNRLFLLLILQYIYSITSMYMQLTQGTTALRGSSHAHKCSHAPYFAHARSAAAFAMRMLIDIVGTRCGRN